MAKTNTKRTELKQMTADQLAGELEALQAKMVELRFEHTNRALKDTTVLAKTRHAIARILTLQRSAPGGQK